MFDDECKMQTLGDDFFFSDVTNEIIILDLEIEGKIIIYIVTELCITILSFATSAEF